MQTIVGHMEARRRLARAVASGQVSHAYLFTGPESIGKTALALDFARLLECERPDLTTGDPCGECSSCRTIAHSNHPDVTLVEAAEGKRLLGVDTVREVAHLANLTPSAGRWRIFIIPAAEAMTPNTVNALLKTLEEPPPGVVLMLTSAEPETLLPTLISRCQSVPLQPLSAAEVTRALIERWGMDATAAHELAVLANGRIGWAVRAMEHPEMREERRQQLAQMLTLTAASRDERIRAAAALAADGDTARRALELWTLWWRDVTLAACGATHLTSEGAPRAEAERQGRALGPQRAEAFLRALLAAKVALDTNANPRLTFEVLLLDLPHLAAAPGRR
ncbi:MAG: DNA polymerase III delta prime subunit [Ktedonobacterales bacterium]|nr:MAG: DNA polymerase III delta prime subunit [Ktedonobacterales bacterium]